MTKIELVDFAMHWLAERQTWRDGIQEGMFLRLKPAPTIWIEFRVPRNAIWQLEPLTVTPNYSANYARHLIVSSPAHLGFVSTAKKKSAGSGSRPYRGRHTAFAVRRRKITRSVSLGV